MPSGSNARFNGLPALQKELENLLKISPEVALAETDDPLSDVDLAVLLAEPGPLRALAAPSEAGGVVLGRGHRCRVSCIPQNCGHDVREAASAASLSLTSKGNSMSRFDADVRFVDRLNGDKAPSSMTLSAIVLDKAPGLDGVDYVASNIVSKAPVGVFLTRLDGRVRNRNEISIELAQGRWDRLYLALLDEEGAVIASGAINMKGGAAPSGAIVALVDDITLHERRPN